MIRIILISSGFLGLPTLQELGGILRLVVTGPDTLSGRGRKPEPTPVRKIALEKNLPVLSTPDVNQPETLARIQAEKPEIIVVADFGQLLKGRLLEIPSLATVNIHPSLLPRYRGAAPIERAILNREEKTGVTIIQVTRKMDAGPIICQEETPIHPGENAPALRDRLARLGADMIRQKLPDLANGTAQFTPQEEAEATYAPMITREEGRISWQKSAPEISALVRALAGRRCAYTFLPETGSRLLVHQARTLTVKPPPQVVPGTVLAENRQPAVVCRESMLALERLQVAGKNPVSGEEFLRGYPFVLKRVLG